MQKFAYIFICLFALLPFTAKGHVSTATKVVTDTEWQNKHNRPHFDPKKYQDDLEAFITKEANLTQQEAQEYFPQLREMQKKLRELTRKQYSLYRTSPSDEKAALEAIKTSDAIDIQIKKLQNSYHQRFLKIMPATKVLACIRAEEHFNRNLMRNMGQPFPKR